MEKKLTVRELYELTDKTVDGWDFYIWNMDGSIQHGVINSFYTIESLIENIQNAEVKQIKIGYATLSIFVDLR